MYHDTDSVIYEKIPGEIDAPTGPSLGEWGDEIGYPITEYVALGPKTYAYSYLKNSVTVSVVKSKGFATGFTLDEYRKMAIASLSGITLEPLSQKSLHFERRPVKSSVDQEMVTNLNFTKELAVSMQKVHVVSANRTLPFGHAEIICV